MTLRVMKGTVLALFFSAALVVVSCKGKEKEKNTEPTNTVDTAAPANLPAPDTTTTATITEAQLKDATKDFPGVQATVNNGEVTLTGNISRDNLPRLMQSVQALNPKKVNNNLTIK
jgi:osmotically-inducible protein OsmY